MLAKRNQDGPVRELFIEELAEVKGGQGVHEVLDKFALWHWLKEHLYTTMACGEEGPDTC